MPVNMLVPLNRMRLVTEVLEDVDTPEEVREMLVEEGTGKENEREEGERNMLDNEENGFVYVDSDDDSEEASTSEGKKEDNDETSDEESIYDDNSEIDGNLDDSDDEKEAAEAAVDSDNEN